MLTRKCVGHGCSLVIFAVQIALAALAVLLVYILLRQDIPIPDALHGRIEHQLARFGLEATFDSAHFDPAGRIYVQGLRLQPAGYAEPVLEAADVYIQLDRLELLAGRPVLERLDVDNVRLMCPPSISPSGITETIATISTARIYHHRDTWNVVGLAGTAGPIELSLHGNYTSAPREEGARPTNIHAILAEYRRQAPQIVRARQWLNHADGLAVVLNFDGTGRDIALDLVASAREWHDPRIGDARRVRLETSISIEDAKPVLPLTVKVHLDKAGREGLVTAGDIDLTARWASMPTSKNPWPERIDLAARRVQHPKITLPAITAVIDPTAYPKVHAEAWLPLEGEPLAISVTGDAAEGSGTVSLQGRFGSRWLAKASDFIGRDVTYYANIETPPDFTATATIGPGFKWKRVEGRVLSGPIVARGVQLDRARIDGTVTPDRAHLDRLELSRGDEYASGTYDDNLRTRDNRVLLRGAMRPPSISPWFSGWWSRFWDDYGFHGRPPLFEIDVQGSWVQNEKTLVRGWMSGEAVTVRGHPFNEVSSRFFIRPGYYDLYEAALRRTEGRIDGQVQLDFPLSQRIPRRQEWKLTSTADLVELADIFGPGGSALFEPYRYDTPPTVVAHGIIEHQDDEYESNIDLHIHTDKAFRYYDFPLESLDTTVKIHNAHVELPDLKAGYAEGIISGSAVVDNGQLTIDAVQTDSDYDLAVDTFNKFLEKRSPKPAPPNEPTGLSGRKVGGRLDIKLAATGPLTEYESYEGLGEAQITGGDLADINLFGPLGDVLGSLGIKLGNLSLHDATSTFEVHHDKIVFPKIRITGHSGRLETDGTYRISDGAVDFKARLYPLRESSGVFSQFFGIILDPFSFLLEMRLTGTLREPRWSFTRDPRSILRDLTRQKEQKDATPPEPPVTPETTPSSEASEPNGTTPEAASGEGPPPQDEPAVSPQN